MTRTKAPDIVPVVAGWIMWEVLTDDGNISEEDRKSDDAGRLAPNPKTGSPEK